MSMPPGGEAIGRALDAADLTPAWRQAVRDRFGLGADGRAMPLTEVYARHFVGALTFEAFRDGLRAAESHVLRTVVAEVADGRPEPPDRTLLPSACREDRTAPQGPVEAPLPRVPGVEPVLRAVDSVRLRVDDLDEALAFYRDGLGLRLLSRGESAATLRLPDGPTPMVLETGQPTPGMRLRVGNLERAVDAVVRAGGVVLTAPADDPAGRRAVVRDPSGNPLVLVEAPARR